MRWGVKFTPPVLLTLVSQFSDMRSSSIFFEVVLFVLAIIVTGPSFISISLLVLELWQFSFIRDWPEIRKSETAPYEFCLISGDWRELGIPNLARMSPIKCNFTVSELLREIPPPPPPPPPAKWPNLALKVSLEFLNFSLYILRNYLPLSRPHDMHHTYHTIFVMLPIFN